MYGVVGKSCPRPPIIPDVHSAGKRRNRDVIVRYDHLCYLQKIDHSVPRCSGRIDSSSVLVGKTLPSLRVFI